MHFIELINDVWRSCWLYFVLKNYFKCIEIILLRNSLMSIVTLEQWFIEDCFKLSISYCYFFPLFFLLFANIFEYLAASLNIESLRRCSWKERTLWFHKRNESWPWTVRKTYDGKKCVLWRHMVGSKTGQCKIRERPIDLRD